MSDSSCPSRETLGAFLSGCLRPAEGDQVSAHLLACADCQRRLEQIEPLDDSVIAGMRKLGGAAANDRGDGLRELISRFKQRSDVFAGGGLGSSNDSSPSSAARCPDPALDTPRPAGDPKASTIGPRAQRESQTPGDRLRELPGAGQGLDESPARSFARSPEQIGRYRIKRVLGSGGFATVYLGFDEDLQRHVAIKVPRPERVADDTDAQRYLAEARILASLDHPNIVPVHDVGRTDDGMCYVVSKFIEGSDLREAIQRKQRSLFESAELIALVAEALHYAHTKGLVHRDVKPANILLDAKEKPYVADFGIALRDEDFGNGGDNELVGTPTYMSPEQARGEGHLVDGRSDVFSLGVVFYELLTGVNPFRGANWAGSVFKITMVEVKPPRQINDSIPKELERICLKALSRRATDRYTTAKDFADDLRHFLSEVPQVAVQTRVPKTEPTVPESQTSAPTPPSDSRTIKIVPKGLRSFDAQDADFFLELLAGPRDRDGLPDSIRFWKSRIEETDPDETFRVGLIYGPSGCGKSSLVKAGLIPRLAQHILPLYVEATSDETETRLLHGLRKRCPALPKGLCLKEILTALRRGQGIPAGTKVLIVLDQFEQWLHARRDQDNAELVEAIRQCDGGRVQCIVMVRDDFWLAVSRFMRELEVRLVEAQNSALVDLFDTGHARKVLAAFGRAFGKLPQKSSETAQDQQQFLDEAARALAHEGKVVCVRLALFADMMKGKTWTPAALKEVGGTEGIGATFLEETFSASTAPPEHRLHQTAARSVLRALLPESGTDIKGHMRSYEDLLPASGYGNRPQDFDDLIRILDSELRLITPSDPEGSAAEKSEPLLAPGYPRFVGASRDTESSGFDASVAARLSAPKSRHYQLTHDYLVPSLREWLTRKQKETRRGRAELRLADRAALWNAKQERRLLPSLGEYLNIRLLTDKEKWTQAQRRMMAKAERAHAIRSSLVGLATLVLVAIGLAINSGVQDREKRNYTKALVQSLLAANTADVGDLAGELHKYRRWATPFLKEIIDNKVATPKQTLHARLALVRDDPSQADYVSEQLLAARVEDLPVIIILLKPHKERVQERLWNTVKNDASSACLHAAAALAVYDPDNPEWQTASPDVVTGLMSVAPVELKPWILLLRPVGERLAGPLETRYRSRSSRRESQPPLAPALADYLKHQPKKLTEMILLADSDGDFTLFLDALRQERSACIDELRRLVKQSPPPNAKPEIRNAFWKKQANAAVCLFGLDDLEAVWPLLKHSPNPSLRSFIIDRLARLGADSRPLAGRLQQERDTSIRQALILSLGEFDAGKLSIDERQGLLKDVSALYRQDPDPGVHSAARWMLKQFQAGEVVTRIDGELQRHWEHSDEKERHWIVNSEGQTFLVVDGPAAFLMGEKATRQGRPNNISLAYRLAMATEEVTVQQFQRFRSAYQPFRDTAPTPDCPANFLTWYDCVAYCNWLSRREGIPKKQWCYEPNEEGAYEKGVRIRADFKQRQGYRLPTEAEWEYVCRANVSTDFCFGEPEELLDRYAWYSQNSRSRTWPPGRLRPNAFGAFDIHGNVFEWCHDAFRWEGAISAIVGERVARNEVRIARGGAFNNSPMHVLSAYRYETRADHQSFNLGFRLAKTYPMN